jgi:hypothetical protein
MIADALDDPATRAMLADFADHRLAEMRPQASLVYYREFFGGDRANQAWRKRSTDNPGSSSSSRSTGGSR